MSDDPGFRQETHSTYEPTPEEVAARARHPVDDALDRHRSEADYIDRTIETVRNHREADNCWPQWANIFADEIEDLRADVQRLRDQVKFCPYCAGAFVPESLTYEGPCEGCKIAERLREERDALAEAQQFPVETVMSWKRRAESAERMVRYARVLLDPERQDEPDEENALRAYEALSGIPLSQPADQRPPERTLELVMDIVERGVGPGTTPEEALATIGHLIDKRHPRRQP